MYIIDDYGNKIYIVILPINTNLNDVHIWLNNEIGDQYEPIDVNIVLNKQELLEYYTYLYCWQWLSEDNMNNLIPCYKVGFHFEDDAVRCKLIWG